METRSGKTFEDYKILDKPSKLATSTSEFRQIDVNTLKINFLGTNEKIEIFDIEPSYIPDFFYIKNYDKLTIRTLVQNQNINKILTREEMSLSKYLDKIIENEELTRGTSESNTDSLVNYILKKLNLDEDPFLLRIQPNYKFYIQNHEINSNPEFSIEKDNLVVFIDEDKHIKNIGPSKKWGENQIAGEILASAYNNFNNMSLYNKPIHDKQIVYSIRVIGTKFTFYKAIITYNYLQSLGDGFPNENFLIYRFPNNKYDESFSHYDYTIPEERKIIIEMLFRLHEKLFNI